ncbi:MAG: NUDIX hydrolase [Propioniciclava sp.]
MTPTIAVSAVVLTDSAGRVLTVRKQGTSRFMLPGGKPEEGESPDVCAIRECAEEVGAVLDAERLKWLGHFVAPAANEAGHLVDSQVFIHPPVVVAGPSAEIAELRWLDPRDPLLPDDLAPMLAHHVLPALVRAESAPDGEPLPGHERG